LTDEAGASDSSALASALGDVTLRAYTPADLDSLYQMDVVCFEKPFRFSKRDMRRFAEARKAQVLIAEADEKLAGFSIVHLERRGGECAGYLVTLDIAPAFRRLGLAHLLMTQAEGNARDAGCGAMLLHVFTENMGAIALYEKLAYERLHLAADFYGAGRHAWVYRKRLVR